MNTNNIGSNSVVTEVMKECEDWSSSHAVFVPLTTDMDLKKTTDKPIGQDKKKVIFPLKETKRQPIFACKDIREKKMPNGLTIKKTTKENVSFSCQDIQFKQVSRSTEAVDLKTVRAVNTEKESSLNDDNEEVNISASTRVTIANNEP